MSESTTPSSATESDAGERLFAAIQAGEGETVLDLLADDPTLAAAVNEHGINALMWALYHRQQPLAEAVAVRRDELEQPLTLAEASALGRLDEVRDLLRLGHDVGAFTGDGFTPLHLASFFGRDEIVAALLGAGAPVAVAARNPSAVHPLHSAAAVGSTPVCRMLLEAGAEVDAQQHGGFTALMSAALHGNRELVDVLLGHGAAVDIEAEDGRTAAAMARDGGHDDVAAELEPGD